MKIDDVEKVSLLSKEYKRYTELRNRLVPVSKPCVKKDEVQPRIPICHLAVQADDYTFFPSGHSDYIELTLSEILPILDRRIEEIRKYLYEQGVVL